VFHGILGLLLLLGDVWAIINIAQSRETTVLKHCGWCWFSCCQCLVF